MCGVSGIVQGDVKAMIDKQVHRGPDNSSSYANCLLQLGHNRLSILDLSENGNQPMETERYALTYNGEIYNYLELKSYLNTNDDLADYNPDNDAKTLLRYIDKFGIHKALNDSNGMFGFGLYDKKKQLVYLAVDRFAQKPIYYLENPFAFASSPAAIIHLKDSWKINEQALQSYWKLGGVMQDSLLDGIKKVNASELVTYDLLTKKITTTRYWEPTYQENVSDIEELILDSIRKVKVSDVPIYIFLSGGIDSTLVASQFKGGNAIHMDSPEHSYAVQAANKFGINLCTVTPAQCDPIAGMDDYVTKTGEPAMAALTPWIVAKEAARFCKVAVSANGADEIFCGYERISENVTDYQMNHIFRHCIDYEVRVPQVDPRLSSGRWLELMTYIQCDLNKTLDAASMCHSLEVRAPFLDHRLVEMALSIPASKHGRKLTLKGMLSKMGFDSVFLSRNKMGFSLYTPVPGLDKLQVQAYDWANLNGFLKLTGAPNHRDYLYLTASAYSFQRWHKSLFS